MGLNSAEAQPLVDLSLNEKAKAALKDRIPTFLANPPNYGPMKKTKIKLPDDESFKLKQT